MISGSTRGRTTTDSQTRGFDSLFGQNAARQECYAEVGHNGLDHEITLARFKDDFRLETDFLAVLNDFVVEIEIIAVEDERFIGQFFERNRFFLRQDVVAMDDDIHGILCEEERFEFLFLRLRADDAQIDEAFLDADFNLFRTVFIEVQLDLRVFLFEGTQQVGKNRCARDRGQADEDRTLFLLEFIFEGPSSNVSNMKTTRLAWTGKLSRRPLILRLWHCA